MCMLQLHPLSPVADGRMSRCPEFHNPNLQTHPNTGQQVSDASAGCGGMLATCRTPVGIPRVVTLTWNGFPQFRMNPPTLPAHAPTTCTPDPRDACPVWLSLLGPSGPKASLA